MICRPVQWRLLVRSRRLAGAAMAGIILAGLTVMPANAAEPKKPSSSCVTCHTDAEKLKAESATIPVPVGSAMQAGKG